jgi:hypothetical protein
LFLLSSRLARARLRDSNDLALSGCCQKRPLLA